EAEQIELDTFEEVVGKGLKVAYQGKMILMGSTTFTNSTAQNHTAVYISVDGKESGYFEFKNKYRTGLNNVIEKLKNYQLSVLSGDNDGELSALKLIFSKGTNFIFNQLPHHKKEYIAKQEEHCMMVGDGLNDAIALQESTVGVAITNDAHQFTPASDVILDACSLLHLPNALSFAKTCISLTYLCFVVSFLYNVVGLFFAMTGQLSPIVSAILMPISSFTIIFISLVGTYFLSHKHFKERK
ncbi:MAG: HAD-IC family P-type ATPase, partial [Cytophagales bacterium]|nr:HAD-IC family P-type ATPase [Cytophagales bacterium]